MEDVPRTVQKRIESYLKPHRAALIIGPRRVGKTVLMARILRDWKGQTLLLNGEDYDTHALLEQRSAAGYRRLLEGVTLFALDEAQNVPDVGAKLKLMTDEVPRVSILATGSSSFDLTQKAGEPLVGRSRSFHLFPFTQRELDARENPLETRRNLEDRLIYGSYPEAALMERNGDRAAYLRDLVNSYLLKDILSFEGLRNSLKLQNLLRLVAFQMGNEVSYDELGRQLGLSKNTVEKYLGLLADVFVVYRLGAYSGNLRKEVVKSCKWYFWDNGVRNALIGDFRPLALRQDGGCLWESYLLGERIKDSCHRGQGLEYYFWRTYDGQEIDLIETGDGAMRAFEFKWGEKRIPKVPPAFGSAYPGADFTAVSPENYLEFIL
ncbi:MAG: ATP-binding protein [Spirochaetaceae bacterium]|jgi:predicted AAA+ superfamily ATPase|nr:ATP-binding protein [Spirochaetaceae bacterium]